VEAFVYASSFMKEIRGQMQLKRRQWV
jgi:hypothetical protein